MKIYAPQISGSLAINGTSIGNFNNLVSTSSFNQYTSSTSTGSLATTGSNTFVGNQTMSGSVIPAITNTYDLGDVTHQFRHLYLSSGSLYINGTKVLGATGQELQITTDNGQSLKILEAGSDTITLQSADGNITLAASGGGDVILDPTSGIIALKGTTTLYSGNKLLSSDGGAIQIGNDLGITGSIVTTGNINGINLTTFSSSIAGHISDINIKSGSFENKFNTLQTLTSSVQSQISRIQESTSSLNQFTASNSISSLNSYTSSLNTAIQLTGSTVSFLGNIIVYGTQSIINSTNVELADNILYLAPTASIDNDLGIVGHYNDGTYRHAGIFMDASDGHSWKVFNGLQGETNATIDTAGTGFTLADFKAGAITGTSLSGQILASNGVVSSSYQITSWLPTGVVSGSSQLTSSYDARYVLSGSITQTTWDNIASKPGGIVSGSAQTIANLPTGTVSGSSQVVDILSSLNTYTGSNDTKWSTISTLTSSYSASIGQINSVTASLNAATSSYETKGRGIVSGSSQITYTGISSIPGGIVSGSSQITYASVSSIPAGIVSGSSQITYANISSIPGGIVSGSSQIVGSSITTNAITIAGTSTALGGTITAEQIRTAIGTVVTGSAQVSLTATTGYGTYINQAVLTTSSPTFAAVSATTFTGALSGNASTATTLTSNATVARDLYINGSTSGNFGNRLLIGTTSATYTLQDTNLRPTLYMNGAYPVFTLNHTATSNTNHGPTIQFAFDGLTTGGATGRQIVIGAPGNGNHLDFGFSGGANGTNSDYNPHNGIAGYQGVTPLRVFPTGILVGTNGSYPSVATSLSYNLQVNGTGNVSSNFTVGGTLGVTGISTTGVIKGDSGAAYPHSFTNTHAGNTHWTNRGSRMLTSNGTNWAADGKDPIMALVGSTTSTVRGQMIGLALHNENNTTNAFSPIIAFSALSNSSGYNSMYASIMGKKTGTGSGLDTNWNKGELHFYAHGDSYVADTPNFLLSGTAATFSGTITESSSLRYKENVETIKYGLDKVLQMRGVTYNKKDNGVKEIGVIAEEIYDVLPEVVLKNEEGEIDSVSYGRITAILIEAIKEQQKQIEELKSLIK